MDGFYLTLHWTTQFSLGMCATECNIFNYTSGYIINIEESISVYLRRFLHRMVWGTNCSTTALGSIQCVHSITILKEVHSNVSHFELTTALIPLLNCYFTRLGTLQTVPISNQIYGFNIYADLSSLPDKLGVSQI